MFPRLAELKYWMVEREWVRIHKEAYKRRPWSADPIFQQTYFCNVRREDDRVTKWIRENWDMEERNVTVHHHLLAMALARFVNKPSTLEILSYPKNGWTMPYASHWNIVMSNVEKPWGGAYIVSTNGKKMIKHEYIALLLQDLWDFGYEVRYDSCQECWKSLTKFDGLGSFMAAQVVADLKNTHSHPLTNAVDWWTFVAPGPGSLRGLAWVMDVEKVTPGQFREHFHRLRGVLDESWEQDVGEVLGDHIHAQDLQNCLCEFDKYMRVKNGTGRSKRRYAGI